MKTIGFLGGSFDPIHFGHLHLAIEMLERRRLDQVVFCPASFSPTKSAQLPSASKRDRLEMVALAIEPIPQFTLLDWELEREGPSYTIDTIRSLVKEIEGQPVRYHLILGEDSIVDFAKWKEVEELVRLAPPLIGTRISPVPFSFPPSLQKTVIEGLTKIPVMEISSTQVRDRLSRGCYCGHLIHSKVLEYIHNNRLYF